MGTVYNFTTYFSDLRLEPPLTEEFVTCNGCAYVDRDGIIRVSVRTKVRIITVLTWMPNKNFA